MRRLAAIALAIALLVPAASFAVQPDEILKDPALETRARDFIRELAAAEPGSDAFTRKITGFSHLGDAEMRASSDASRQLLQRPAASLAVTSSIVDPSPALYCTLGKI